MKKWGILLLIIMFVPGLTIHAQDVPGEPIPNLDPWPVIERCVGPATAPPERWSYPGVILLEGYEGLHGVSADWETPRVMAFNAYGGNKDSLSPDGLWYAIPQISIHQQQYSFDTSIHTINNIHVYSTINPREVIVVPWQAQMYVFHLDFGAAPHLRWRDNEHFVYPEGDSADGYAGETWLINPFVEDMAPRYGMPEAATHQYAFYPSPDWSRAVVNPGEPSDWRIFDPLSGDVMGDLPPLQEPVVVWSPDSAHFISQIWHDRSNLLKVLLVDVDGVIQGVLYEDSIAHIDWSYDSRYVSFGHSLLIDTQSSPRLYLADIENELVIDTCLTLTPGAWSPTGLQLAMMPSGKTDRPIHVFDLRDWALYTVAYHSGSIIGWRN